jgi:anti-sigma-K factor RskA
MDDDELSATEREELARVDALLADPALWAEPPAELQEQVVAAIAHESGRARRRRLTRYAVGALAASVVIVAGAAVALQQNRDHQPVYSARMTASQLAPEAAGEVKLTRTASGWRIQLHVEGLPRRDGGEFYEAWLKNQDGVLVSIGTFNDGRDVVLWSGVSPAGFGMLTITREVADGNPGSSGEMVMSGRPARS